MLTTRERWVRLVMISHAALVADLIVGAFDGSFISFGARNRTDPFPPDAVIR